MTWKSKVKTNANSIATLPAVAFVNANHLTLSLGHKQNLIFTRNSREHKRSSQHINGEIDTQIEQLSIPRQSKLVIILASDLTLFSSQEFPSGLSEFEIQQLLELKHQSESNTTAMSTLYDFFVLQQRESHCLYGVFEARKMFLEKLMQQFEAQKLHSIGLIPQVIVVLNHIISKQDLNHKPCCLALLLSQRLYLIYFDKQSIKMFQEHTIVDDSVLPQTIQTFTQECFGQNSTESITIIFSWNNASDLRELEALSPISFANEIDLNGELMINWFKQDYDFYKSAGLA